MKCAVCGMSFTPARRGQDYCARECRRRAQRERANECRMEPNREPAARKPRAAPAKTDWQAIGRLMAQTNKSYGQLVKEGLL